MDKLPLELKVEIASYVKTFFFLGCCSRSWLEIVNSPHTKYKWLLKQYGRIHALTHAIRIGKPFLNLEVAELLLKNTHISRHFVQRLKLAQEKHYCWGNNISKNIYEHILNFKKEYASSNCDDLQLVRQILEKRGNEIDLKLVIEAGFTPFPLSP